MRSRTRPPGGEWSPWQELRDRPTKTPRCSACGGGATAVENTVVMGATVRLGGRVERHPAIVASPFFCGLHGSTP